MPLSGGAPHGSRHVNVPAPRSGWLTSTKQHWAQLWESPLARAFEVSTDLPALDRLFSMYDERERFARLFKKQRLVLSTKKTLMINPLGREIRAYDAEIRQLEDRFGLSPMARLRLGAQYAETAGSLEELNQELLDDGLDRDDPRLTVIDGGADVDADEV